MFFSALRQLFQALHKTKLCWREARGRCNVRILVSASFCVEHLNIRFKSSSCAFLGFANKSKNCACARVSPYPVFLCSTANVVYPGYAHDGKKAGF